MPKAAICRTHGKPLTIEEVEVAPPGPEQVRVDLEVCAICHSDITYAAGGWGGDTPAIYGHEAAGVVESIGEGVEGVKPGDRVTIGLLRSCGRCFHCRLGEEHLCVGTFPDDTPFTDQNGSPVVRGLRTGAFAQQTVVHRSQVVILPDGISLEAASLLGCGVLTGFGAVTNTARMDPGGTVVVVGAGGVGIGAIQGAAIGGAVEVWAVDLDDGKLELAQSFGATGTVNSRTEDAVARVKALNGGVGPDYVFVAVGVQAVIDQALTMVRAGGTVVLVGMPGNGQQTSFETVEFADASIRLLGCKMGSARMNVDVPKLIDLHLSGLLDLDRMISNVYALDDINRAIDEVNGGTVIRNLISLR